jgi:hypothetical protein
MIAEIEAGNTGITKYTRRSVFFHADGFDLLGENMNTKKNNTVTILQATEGNCL